MDFYGVFFEKQSDLLKKLVETGNQTEAANFTAFSIKSRSREVLDSRSRCFG